MLRRFVALAGQKCVFPARNAKHSEGVGGRAAPPLPPLPISPTTTTFVKFLFFKIIMLGLNCTEMKCMCVLCLTLEIVKNKAVSDMFPFRFCRVLFKSIIKDI